MALIATLIQGNTPANVHMRPHVDRHRLTRLLLAGSAFGLTLGVVGSVAIGVPAGLVGGLP